MEYRTIEEIQRVAELYPEAPEKVMTRAERLERWATILRDCSHRLKTLHGTEHRPPDQRARMRSDDSPLTVAYADPVLRGQGLKDDTYGEAKRFFELSDFEMHTILCDCHLGGTVSGRAVAFRVASTAKARTGFLQRLFHAFGRQATA